MSPQHPARVRPSRRAMIRANSAALTATRAGMASAQPAMPQPQPALSSGPGSVPAPVRVRLTIDGREHTIMVEARTDLLDALRDNLALKALKKG